MKESQGTHSTSESGHAAGNTELFESLSQEKKRLELLYRLSHCLAESLEIDEVAQRALNELCAELGLRWGGILIYGKQIYPAATLGLESALLSEIYEQITAETGEGTTRDWVAQHHYPVVMNDLSKSPYTVHFACIAEQIRSALCVPLVSRDELIGVLCLCSDQADFFNQESLRLIESAAATVGLAIANALLLKETRRLFLAEQEKRELAEALEEAAAFVSSNLNLNQVLDRILKQVARVVDGDTFNIMLVKDKFVQIARWRGYESLQVNENLPVREIPLDRYPNLLKMMQQAAPMVIADTLSDPDWVPNQEYEWRRSYVGAPIAIGEQTIGFLNVNSRQPNKFEAEDAHRLKIFADHIATAIENARLYQAQREYAEHLEARVEERAAELHAQYARLQAVLRSTADGIIVSTAEGALVECNPVADAWLNHSLSPEDTRKFRAAICDLSARAAEHPESILELQGLDLQLNAAPIMEPAGDAHIVIAAHDVSHLKAFERIQSQFVSDVSHELRTPVTTAKLYAELLRRSSPEKYPAYLDALEQELNHQAKLIEDILDFSRIDAGRLMLNLQLTDLSDLVESLLSSHTLLAQHHKVTLTYDLPPASLIVFVDPDKLKRVLINLIVNAIQYTPEGGQVHAITGTAQAAERQWATFEIQDNGMGISEKELPQVFNRFFRGVQPREKQIEGTGLGLAIAKEIVDLHGGWIDVQSKVGMGSTFTVWLPLANT